MWFNGLSHRSSAPDFLFLFAPAAVQQFILFYCSIARATHMAWLIDRNVWFTLTLCSTIQSSQSYFCFAFDWVFSCVFCVCCAISIFPMSFCSLSLPLSVTRCVYCSISFLFSFFILLPHLTSFFCFQFNVVRFEFYNFTTFTIVNNTR